MQESPQRGSGSHTAQAGESRAPVHRTTSRRRSTGRASAGAPPPPSPVRVGHPPKNPVGAGGRPCRTPIGPSRRAVRGPGLAQGDQWHECVEKAVRPTPGPRARRRGRSGRRRAGDDSGHRGAGRDPVRHRLHDQRLARRLHRQRHHQEPRRPAQRLDAGLDLPTAASGCSRAGRPRSPSPAATSPPRACPTTARLATGASTSIGFNGAWSGSNPKPTSFTLNGVVCNGGTTPADHAPADHRRRPPTPPPTDAAAHHAAARHQGRQPVRRAPRAT